MAFPHGQSQILLAPKHPEGTSGSDCGFRWASDGSHELPRSQQTSLEPERTCGCERVKPKKRYGFGQNH